MEGESDSQVLTPEGQTPTPAPSQITTPAKKMVPESDLIGVRNSLESKLSDTQKAHDDAMLTQRSLLSDTQTKLYSTEARLKTLEEDAAKAQQNNGNLAAKEAELVTANERIAKLMEESTQSKRESIARTFNIPVESLKEKDITQLGYLEEALKMTAGSTGSGSYALVSGGGGSTPASDMERAAATIQAAEQREPGTRIR